MALDLYGYHVVLLAPVFLGWLARVVARAPGQERANRLLAVFLALVAAGFLVEVVDGLLLGLYSGPIVLVRSLHEILVLADPPFLLAYSVAVAAPQRLGANRKLAWLWAAYAAAATGILALFLPSATSTYPWGTQAWGALAEVAYVNGTYLAAFGLLVRAHARARRRYMVRQMGFLAAGVGFVGASRSAALFWAGPAWWNQSLGPGLVALTLVVGLGTLALVGAIAGRGWPTPLAPRRDVALAAAALVAFCAFWALALAGDGLVGAPLIGARFYSYRWVIFAGIVGYGILRHQLFDFELRVHEAVALLGSAVVGVVLALAAAIRVGGGDSLPMSARVVGLLVFAGATLLSFVACKHGLAAVLPRVELTAEHGRRLGLYEATLEYALAKSDWDQEERRFVECLREVCGVTPEEHAQVESRLRAEATGSA